MKKTVVINGHHNRRLFFCKNECLYVKKLTYVEQTEIKKKHSGH